MSCNKEMAKALEHDCWVDYKIEEIYDKTGFAETKPPFLTLRSSKGRTFQDLKKICGNGTYANGKAIKVGVGDTGVDQTHVRNGELGDVKFKNFTPDRSAYDINGHGSHVTGHIGARKNDSQIEGIASDCELYHAKVLGGRQGSGTTAGINAGVQWLADQGCKIINLSLGGGGFDSRSNELYKKLDEQGIIVNAAAGNDGQGGERGGYPGRYDSTVCVTAVDYNKKIASFSSETRSANITGYGVGVDSLWINGRRASISGTSMATPDQSGIMALLVGYFDRKGIKVKNKAHYLELVQPGIIDLGIDGPDTYFGRGFIDIWAVIDHYEASEPVKPVDPVDPEEPTCPIVPDCPVEEKNTIFNFKFLGKYYELNEIDGEDSAAIDLLDFVSLIEKA